MYRMPPANRIESVTLHNMQHWPSGRWIPMRFEVGSWVTLNPDTSSSWGRDSSRYNPYSQQFLWKAQVQAFELSGEGRCISRVKVRHAYEPWQILLDPDLPRPRIPCNYLFPTFFDDWVHPVSIVGLVVGMHVEIGTMIHHDQSARERYDHSMFFYCWMYVPPAGERLYGELEEIQLPRFSSIVWPLPDMLTSETFRAKMRLEFRAAMKHTTGSLRSYIQWFMPLHVFVDLFASASARKRTPSVYTICDINDEVFGNLMDPGWNSKTVDMGDIIRCTVNCPSVVFRFHIARQTLYVNFFFIREKWVAPLWIQMEHQLDVCLIDLHCEIVGSNPLQLLKFKVGMDWPISHLRHEVQIHMGPDTPVEFKFVIGEPGEADKKLNQRREKIYNVADIAPPKILKLISC